MSTFTVTDLENYIKESYLSYSTMVLSGRALSYVQDGMKPVHRHILYAMSKLQMTASSSYKKSARVVGDVIGKYHPHGDAAVYDAMVRMAQPWSLRYPLIDGQGNFGSRDGDSAAAMRYTEVRTTPLTDTILSELNVGAVDYIPNYDGTLTTPRFLPGALPIELLNGSTGIAVGMAADIPSHNVRDVANAVTAFIKDNNIDNDGIMEQLKGPDLPTGGQIINDQATINQAYKEGRGKLHVRARWEVEKLSHGQWRIKIIELPHDLSPSEVLANVATASVYEPPKEKGKEKGKEKKPNQRLLDLKHYIKNNIDDIRDITSADDPPGSAKMIIEPKSSRQDPEEFMAGVVSMLGLQSTLKVNLTAVSIDKLPRQRGIKEIISDWVEFRRESISNRTKTRLSKIADRLELIEGRLTIMDLIDEVIEIIREHDEPKEVLMARFDLNERQASDILEIRLRELRKLEEYKLKDEKEKLVKEQAELEALLSSTRKMNNQITREIEQATKKFEDDRRTLIKEEKTIDSSSVVKTVQSDPITLWFTNDNWVIARKGHLDENDAPNNSLKVGDSFNFSLQTKLDQQILILGTSGRAYTFQPSNLSFGRGNGTHLNTLINLNGDKVYWADTYADGNEYLLAHNHGYGFIVASEDLLTKQKAGKECFKLTKFEGCEISAVLPVGDGEMLNIWTDKNRYLQFCVDEVNSYPKSQGMRLVNLAADELVEGYALSDRGTYSCNGVNKRFDESYLKKRAAAPKKYK